MKRIMIVALVVLMVLLLGCEGRTSDTVWAEQICSDRGLVISYVPHDAYSDTAVTCGDGSVFERGVGE